MDVLFIHPNFPGQFRRLAQSISKLDHIQVYGLGDDSWMQTTEFGRVTLLRYAAPESFGKNTHPYIKSFEAGIRRGQQVARFLMQQKLQGFEPTIIYIHPGWGDGLFLKDIFPNSIIIGLFEYFYHPRSADVGFDPEFPLSLDDIFRIRVLNSLQLHTLESCDIRICPTEWQKSRYPTIYQNSLSCIHEGIDTDSVSPNTNATLRLSDGFEAHYGDEILTFVSRSLEPYRGFHVFMRSLPNIMRNNPNCHIIIVGNDAPHYGPGPQDAESWKAKYLDSISDRLDVHRIHFTGTLGYEDYLSVLRISRVHIYLTYPFILSWSMLEAMSSGCLVIASDTPPVTEIITHEVNGLLFPFFDSHQLTAKVTDALQYPEKYTALRNAARETIVKHYDFTTCILPKHHALLQQLTTD